LLVTLTEHLKTTYIGTRKMLHQNVATESKLRD